MASQTRFVNNTVDSQWDNPDNAFVENDLCTSTKIDTAVNTYDFTNNPFTIPAGATITGLYALFKWGGDGGDIFQIYLKDVNGVSQGAQGAAPVHGCADASLASMGGDGDLLGGTWTPAHINSADFQCWIRYNSQAKANTMYIDFIEVTVYYTVPISDGSVALLGKADIKNAGSTELLGKTDIQHEATTELLAHFIPSISGTRNLSAKFDVLTITSEDLPAKFEVGQGTTELFGKFSIEVPSSSAELPAKVEIQNSGSAELLGKTVITIPWISGWSFKKVVTLVEQSGGTYNDYPTIITVAYDPHMKNDFADCRFTEADGVTLIPYGIVEKTDGVSCSFVIKRDYTPGCTLSVYLYYGNPDAADASVDHGPWALAWYLANGFGQNPSAYTDTNCTLYPHSASEAIPAWADVIFGGCTANGSYRAYYGRAKINGVAAAWASQVVCNGIGNALQLKWKKYNCTNEQYEHGSFVSGASNTVTWGHYAGANNGFWVSYYPTDPSVSIGGEAGSESGDLLGKFEVGQGAQDLLTRLIVGVPKGSEDLLARLTVIALDSEGLLARLTVTPLEQDSKDLLGKVEVGQDSEDLLARLTVTPLWQDSGDLLSKLYVVPTVIGSGPYTILSSDHPYITSAEQQRKLFRNPRGQKYYYALLEAPDNDFKFYKSFDGPIWSQTGPTISALSSDLWIYEDSANSRLLVYVLFRNSVTGDIDVRCYKIDDGTSDVALLWSDTSVVVQGVGENLYYQAMTLADDGYLWITWCVQYVLGGKTRWDVYTTCTTSTFPLATPAWEPETQVFDGSVVTENTGIVKVELVPLSATADVAIIWGYYHVTNGRYELHGKLGSYAGGGGEEEEIVSQTRAVNNTIFGDWTDPDNAFLDDGQCTYTKTGLLLNSYNFINNPFTIPAGATIDGLEVHIRRGGDGNDRCRTSLVDALGSSHLKSEVPPSATCANAVLASVGGSTDRWAGSWTAEHINSKDFSARISYLAQGKANFLYVDYVEVTVYYTPNGERSPGITLGADVPLSFVLGSGRYFSSVVETGPDSDVFIAYESSTLLVRLLEWDISAATSFANTVYNGDVASVCVGIDKASSPDRVHIFYVKMASRDTMSYNVTGVDAFSLEGEVNVDDGTENIDWLTVSYEDWLRPHDLQVGWTRETSYDARWYSTMGKSSRDLPAKFETARVADLYAKFVVGIGEASTDLLGKLTVGVPSSLAELLVRFEVGQDSEGLLGKLTVRHSTSVDLLARSIIRHADDVDLPSVSGIRNLSSADLRANIDITHSVTLLGRCVIRHVGIPVDLLGSTKIRHAGVPLELSAKFKVVHWKSLFTKSWIRHHYYLWTNRHYVNGVVELDEENLTDPFLGYVIQGVMDDLKSWLINEGMLVYDLWTDITRTPKLIRRATTYGTVASLYARDANNPHRRIVMGLRPVRLRAVEERAASERAMDYWESRMERMMTLYLTSGGRRLMFVDTEDEEPVFSMDDIPFYTEDPYKTKTR